MAMSKKDYELLATEFKSMRDVLHRVPEGLRGERLSTPEGVVETLMVRLVTAFEKENPKFDGKRFMAACGGGPTR